MQIPCDIRVIYLVAPDLPRLVNFKHADAWLVLSTSAVPAVRELEQLKSLSWHRDPERGFPGTVSVQALCTAVALDFFIFLPTFRNKFSFSKFSLRGALIS